VDDPTADDGQPDVRTDDGRCAGRQKVAVENDEICVEVRCDRAASPVRPRGARGAEGVGRERLGQSQSLFWKPAARGVAVDRQVVWVMLASGGIAGMIGTHLVVGETYRFLDGDLVVSGFAWSGLLVALLARHRPGPMLAAGAFFAALQIGGLAMQRNVNVPWQIAQVLQAVVIIMIAGRFVLKARRETAAVIEGETTVTGEV